MKRNLLLAFLCSFVLSGCVSAVDAARSKYSFDIPTANGMRRLRIETPKKFSIDRLTIKTTAGDEFDVVGLTTDIDRNALQAALVAQQSQDRVVGGLVDSVKESAAAARVAAEAYGKMNGLPIQAAKPDAAE